MTGREIYEAGSSGTMREYDQGGKGTLFSSLADWLGNQVTGDIDWQRQVLSAEYANAFNASEAEKSRAFSREEAQKARDWQERMSNTAFQRQTVDLKAAGYNPALVLGGSGASFGSGAVASTSTASGTGPASGTSGQGFSSLLKAAANTALAILTQGVSLGISASKNATAIAVAREYAKQPKIYIR